MERKKILEQYRRDVSRCVRCGACRAVCPSFQHGNGESFSPRGRIAIIMAALEGRVSFSEIFRDRLATCMECLSCETACPAGVPVAGIIRAAREQAVIEAGPGIMERLMAGAFKHEAAMRYLLWLAPVVMRLGRASMGSTGGNEPVHQLPPGDEMQERRKRQRVAFFPGCGLDHFQRDILSASIEVLSAIGYDVVVPENRVCCGLPLLSLGDRIAAEKCSETNATIFSGLGVDAVITACATCGLTFKKEYPKLLPPGVPMPEVMDIHEVLKGRIPHDLRIARTDITIHDPCHLARGQGLSDTVRNVLRSVTGITIKEMAHPDRCCGFGGVMRATHKDLSMRIGAAKAEDIIRTGAEAVVTGCPGCRMQITDSLGRAGYEIPVLHTVQVVAMALKGRGDLEMRRQGEGRCGDRETRRQGDRETRGRGDRETGSLSLLHK